MLALLELISLLCLRSLWPSFFFFVVELEIPTLIGLLTLLSFFFLNHGCGDFFFPIHVLLYTRNTDWPHPARASEQIMKDVHSQEEDLSSLFVALNLFSFWKQKISFLARLWESLANQFLWWNNCVCCLIVFSFTICIASAAAFSLSSPCRFFLTLSLFSYLVVSHDFHFFSLWIVNRADNSTLLASFVSSYFYFHFWLSARHSSVMRHVLELQPDLVCTSRCKCFNICRIANSRVSKINGIQMEATLILP